jgi:cytochrome c biogenesis protein CcmG/thiol:disulfide interchange protein DsbE
MSIVRSITRSQVFWVALGAAGALLAAIVTGAVPMPGSATGTAPTPIRTAPDFRLNTLGGESFHLDAHRGEVVVLNFWATWCPPCRREIPDFVALQRELGPQGLQFVGVALERSAGPDEVRAFARKMNINYPIGMGDGTIARKYGGVRGLPMTFVIGPDGSIRKRVPGMTTKERLRPTLTALLDEAS